LDYKRLLLGDEAIGQAALDAGISGAYAYPGTPSTEILEYIQKAPEAAERDVHRTWSANEKTAVEEALGMSFAGKRALVSMKHVGLNVAADPFINAAITGANGGLLLVVADDPSMHSSQNEQDSRYYAKFAGVPLFEPSSQQEAYDMVRAGFDLSEEVGLPVVMRITTRLAHSRADVVCREPRAENEVRLPADRRQYVLLPVNARRNYAALVEKQVTLRRKAAASPYNRLLDGPDASLGIIAAGIGLNYLLEQYDGAGCPHPVVKIGQYPAPAELVAPLLDRCESVLVIEEGAPFIEERIRGDFREPLPVRGRLDGSLPRTGELSPDAVGAALGLGSGGEEGVSAVVKPRPPQLCKGCPHVDTYHFLNEALGRFTDTRVFSDIGCYTLGALPPFNAIDTCVDMGASITMAKGAADAGVRPAVAVIGDSTFTHSGMTGLLDAVYENTPMTVLILDNDLVGMTGGQPSLSSGRLEGIVRGLGVPDAHLRVLTPLRKHHDENVKALVEEFAHEGVSVVICSRSCIHIRRRQ
jgi:indolepyruvate ferredoxin oxidoreductase alpha subunit